jgi:hypothetical protein
MIRLNCGLFSICIYRINFDDPTTTRPGMLAKSAVLAALEDEERQNRGHQIGKYNVQI